MTDEEKQILNNYGPQESRIIAKGLMGQLTGKGLTFQQAEALLALTKDLLREAKI